ncbi:6005_t:CDS:2 [Funneliformis caledonium]|uniref:6005_t:CDS:1 n=1 Tax=Funneliformis caledonium TaxID=1117310 RepID=A0A9N9GKE2_9GLOM|nr:6005_t:CDS:2 [Funneliformis caledonium]
MLRMRIQTKSAAWCKHCDLARHTQLNAEENLDNLYSAIWMEGPKWKLDEEAEIWERFGDWVSAICDDPNTSELSDQFDAVDESKFANL